MPSTPFFFFFLGSVLFLSWFTTDVHSEKVIDVLKGSSVVLSPGDTESSIISITWKHGTDLAAEWFGGDPTFYRMFNDGCSLNTKTGELTISDVRPEHSGEYTAEINGRILSALKLQVLYKVVNALKGSTVVLSPHLDKAEIISIKWKHGASLAADWIGQDVPFYRSFKDGCSLNTKTGELTINDVRPEHGGEYKPEINGQILSAIKLQVFSPVPKPRITHDCNPEKTNCTLTCSFDRTDDLGDVEVFWILDDRCEKGTEIQITKDTKEETFICSLENPVSSQNSTELKNPLFSEGRRLLYLLILLVIPLIGVGLFLIFHFKIPQRILRFIRVRNEQRSSAVTENTREERQNNGSSTNIQLTGSPAGGDAVHPEETSSLSKTEECNQTSNVTVPVEISPQTGDSDFNGRPRTRDPAEDGATPSQTL